MEIRCTNCGHIGVAAQIQSSSDGIDFICAHCQYPNRLDVDASVQKEVLPQSKLSSSSGAGSKDVMGQNSDRAPSAMRRLVPEPGEGLRCRKCAHFLKATHDNCPRCGLHVDEAARFEPGQAPWEQPPLGQEVAWEQAMLLWDAAVANWTPERVESFAGFVRDQGFHEMGIRRLRFWLITHPEDVVALQHLSALAAKLQSRLIVAQSQAEMSAHDFEQGVSRAKGVLIFVTVLFWTGVFILFLGLFLEQCSSIDSIDSFDSSVSSVYAK